MPDNAPISKREATAGYGAIIQDVASTQEAREEGARMYADPSLSYPSDTHDFERT